jgi:hypothetical protein
MKNVDKTDKITGVDIAGNDSMHLKLKEVERHE